MRRVNDDDDEDEDEEEEEEDGGDAGPTPGAEARGPLLSPGGTDLRRVRQSIHPSRAEVQEALALGMRRSGRRRWQPLEFWKGEHVEYRRARDDEVFSATRAVKEGVLTPDTVKAKKAKRPRAAQAAKGGKKPKAAASADEADDSGGVLYPGALSSRELPKAVKLTREGQENLHVGPRDGHPAYDILCVRRAHRLKFHRLPSDPEAVTDEAAVSAGLRSEARAAAAFDTPTFVTGTVSVPPLCQKDEECTQHCLQIFCVIACQPKGLHVTVADAQFVLSPGDHFFVPHNTVYRVRNFSAATAATIAFTLLKPTAEDEEGEPATD